MAYYLGEYSPNVLIIWYFNGTLGDALVPSALLGQVPIKVTQGIVQHHDLSRISARSMALFGKPNARNQLKLEFVWVYITYLYHLTLCI